MIDEIYKPCGYPVLDYALDVYLTKCEDRIEELETKLANVVDALKFYAYVDDDQGHRARTVLEEIGEKSDE